MVKNSEQLSSEEQKEYDQYLNDKGRIRKYR